MPTSLSGPFPPCPPADLIGRVTQDFGPEEIALNRDAFHWGALDNVRAFEAGLAAVGRELAGFDRILDFGCGPGRLLRVLGELSGQVELHGVDIDPESVAWAQANIPFAQVAVGSHLPPLPYPDDHFDLVLGHSVFTHLDPERQDAWLAELQRITRPDATLLVTVHSTRQFNDALAQLVRAGENPEPYRAHLEHEGVLFIADDGFVGTTHPDWYHTAFHAPWYVFAHWTEFFGLRAYLPEGALTQDLVVLQRMAGDAVAPRLARRATAGDPIGPPPRPAGPRAVPVLPFDNGDTPLTAAQAGERAQLAFEHALRSVADHAARRGPVGRMRHRALHGELERQARIDDGLLGAINDLLTAVGELAAGQRIVGVLRAALDAQADRSRVAHAELRRELGELRARVDGGDGWK